jgi:bacillopeptidase F
MIAGFFLRLLVFLLFLFLPYSGSAQGTALSPGLEEKLNTLSPLEEVSVILTLAGKPDLKRVQEMDRRSKRAHIIRSLRDAATPHHAAVEPWLERRGAGKIRKLWLVNGISFRANPGLIRELALDPRVERIVQDLEIPAPAVLPGVLAAPEWNLSAIQVPYLWGLGFTGTGITVANMDTGVDPSHPDIGPRWRGGSNSWYDPNGEHPSPFDGDGHGTGTMGIMVGGSAGGTDIGVTPGAQWIAVKVFNDAGVAQVSAILSGFQWLLDPDGNLNTDDAPDVVNNSWGFEAPGICLSGPPYNLIREAILNLRTAGIAVVFSAGNSGPLEPSDLSPANYPESYGVGAVDQSLNITGTSSRGPSACDGSIFPKVSAPGVNVRTADLTFGGLFPNSYRSVSGTSFAAPHVAGAMGLLMQAFPGVSISLLELALNQSAQDRGSSGPDNAYGSGIIDLRAAYNLLLTPGPMISINPMAYNFGQIALSGTSQSQVFSVANRGLSNLQVGTVGLGGQEPGHFLLQEDTCSNATLSPGAACTIGVVFSPLSLGNHSAILSVPSNDPSTPRIDLSLSGTGVLLGIVPPSKIGVFRNGDWYRDLNGNGAWDGCGADGCYTSFGLGTDLPVSGDWTGTGTAKIGVFRGGQWFLDLNGNGAWDGCGADGCYTSFGLGTDLPATGSW